MALRICKVTKENRQRIASLKVTEQHKFIETTIPNSLIDAETKYKGDAISVGLYDDNIPVGYAMYGWFNEEEINSVYLNQFIIDSNYQGKGYAKPLLQLLMNYFRDECGSKVIHLSIHPENRLAQKLYESIGFHLTGEIEEERLHGKGYIMKPPFTFYRLKTFNSNITINSLHD